MDNTHESKLRELLYFDKKNYSLEAVQRVVDTCTKSFFTQISEDNNTIMVILERKDASFRDANLKKEIQNRVLEEEVRIKIENETKEIRESLFQSAMKVE